MICTIRKTCLTSINPAIRTVSIWRPSREWQKNNWLLEGKKFKKFSVNQLYYYSNFFGNLGKNLGLNKKIWKKKIVFFLKKTKIWKKKMGFLEKK